MGWGNATIPNKKQYVALLVYSGADFQGKINNTTHKLKIRLPYTGGYSSFPSFTNTQTTAQGEGGDTNNLTLTIPTGNYSTNGELLAEITVSGTDDEYFIKKLPQNTQETIAAFPVDINGTTFNIELIALGGVPDKNFNTLTNGIPLH